MDKIDNVKLNWDVILEPQISSIQRDYEGTDVRRLFQPLIEMLNSNRVPSKVILNKGEIAAYSYILPPVGIRDRIVSSMGFLKDEEGNVSRAENMLEWLEAKARSEKKLLILDGIYNASFLEQDLLKKGYIKIKRVKMSFPLNQYKNILDEENIGNIEESTEIVNPVNINPDLISKIQEEAYASNPDRILLFKDSIKNITYNILLSGYYGKILSSPSFVLVSSEGILGSILVTDGSEEVTMKNIPLIVDFFTNPSFRNAGNGSFILYQSLRNLFLLGFKKVQLWVNENSPAYNFYMKKGFQRERDENITYMKDFRESNQGI